MNYRHAIAIAILAGATLAGTGCAVTRGQESAGAYVDDKVIATTVKAKLLEDKTVGGMSVNVDSLNGTVALNGFAKSSAEKSTAESIAKSVKGVRDVRNNLVIRP